VKKIIIAVIGLLVLAAALFGFWKLALLVWHHAPAVLFWLYMLVPLVLLAIYFYLSNQMMKSNLLQQVLVRFQAAQMTRLQRVRLRFAGMVDFLCWFITWPASIIASHLSQRQATTPYESPHMVLAGERATGFHLIFQPMILGLTLLLFWWIQRGSPSSYLFIAAMMATAFVQLRLLHGLADADSIPTKLRRTRGNPFLKFLVFCASMLLVAIIAHTLWHERVLTMDGAVATSRELVSSQNLTTVFKMVVNWVGHFQGWQPFPEATAEGYELTFAITAVLVGLVLLQAIVRLGDFRKNDEDYVSRAGNALQLGQFFQATEELRNIKNPSVRSNSLLAVAYLGLNRVDEAINITRLQDGAAAPTQSLIYRMLATALVYNTVPAHAIEALLSRWLTMNPPESELFSAVDKLISDARFNREAFLKELRSAPAYPAHYRLVTAVILTAAGRTAEARQELQTTYAEPVLEFTRRWAALMNEFAELDPVNAWHAYDTFTRDNMTFADRLVGEAKTDDERMIAMSVSLNLEQLARFIGSPRRQEWRFFRQRIAERVEKKEVLQVFAGIEATTNKAVSPLPAEQLAEIRHAATLPIITDDSAQLQIAPPENGEDKENGADEGHS
jgi:hypothetical protein